MSNAYSAPHPTHVRSVHTRRRLISDPLGDGRNDTGRLPFFPPRIAFCPGRPALRPPRFDWRRFFLSTLILAAVGWAAAGTPFRGDQALFTEDARRLHDGTVLYRDVWEVTNPGVFRLYEAAGTGFGFTEA